MQLFKRERIPRHNNRPYLERLLIFRCKWFSVMLHRFIGSDDECTHDHPWPFWTWLVKGGYWEYVPYALDGYTQTVLLSGKPDDIAAYPWLIASCRYEQAPDGRWLRGTWYPRWSLLRRRANCEHRVEYDPKRPAVSLVITFAKEKPWGFFTRFGWIPYQQYSYADHCS